MSTGFTTETAGCTLRLVDETRRWAAGLALSAGTDGSDQAGPADVTVVLERTRAGFDTAGLQPVTRGVWSDGSGVVVESAGGSGFAQHWSLDGDRLLVRARWRPGPLELAAARLRSRFHALSAQVLLHYPALWLAGTRSLAPLHASVVEVGGLGV
ncbi:MAG: hypothetical protein HOQ45_09645, partial [Nocardioidaceae bacterium]|nr:hypothetical protein [Nocardioidaceae bacterium]